MTLLKKHAIMGNDVSVCAYRYTWHNHVIHLNVQIVLGCSETRVYTFESNGHGHDPISPRVRALRLCRGASWDVEEAGERQPQTGQCQNNKRWGMCHLKGKKRQKTQIYQYRSICLCATIIQIQQAMDIFSKWIGHWMIWMEGTIPLWTCKV